MNAIEIRNLSKSFRGMYALNGLNMTVPVGAIYGFIGAACMMIAFFIGALIGGVLFAVGLGAISNLILKKTSLV